MIAAKLHYFSKMDLRGTWFQLNIGINVSILITCPLNRKWLGRTIICWHSTFWKNCIHVLNVHILPVTNSAWQKRDCSWSVILRNSGSWRSGDWDFSHNKIKILVDCVHVQSINGNCKHDAFDGLSWLKIVSQVFKGSNTLELNDWKELNNEDDEEDKKGKDWDKAGAKTFVNRVSRMSQWNIMTEKVSTQDKVAEYPLYIVH